MKTNRSRKLGITLAGVLALIVLSARVHAAALAYTVTVLDSLGETYSIDAVGINASGKVVGTDYVTTAGSSSNAVVWTGTTLTVLDRFARSFANGYAINASGQVAGSSQTTLGSLHAVVWNGSTPTDLGTLGGNESYAFGINDSGQVVGNSQTPTGSGGGNGAIHAVVWNGTTPTDLGPGRAIGINASGQVVGSNASGAVRWTGTTAEVLGTLGGSSAGYAINDAGQAAGTAYLTGNSAAHAVVWNGTTPTDLGTLGGTNSNAYGINNLGDVIGMSDITGNSTQHAFLYTGGVMYDLFTLLLLGSGVTDLNVTQGGNGINDSGQIAATGTVGGQTHALRLDPVATPEPSSLALLGGFALGIASRRKRQVRAVSDSAN